MVDVKRDNVVLSIEEEDVERYFAKGYSVLDKFGNVVKASVPSDVGTLRKAFVEHTELLKQKDNEIADLRSQIETLLATVSAKTKSTSNTTKKQTQ